jgi:hypothetical protein
MIIPALIALTFVGSADFQAPKATTADHCVSADDTKADLVTLAAVDGGIVAEIKGTSAQSFSDAWRKQLSVASVSVTAVYLWARAATVILEIGGDGCLATVTGIDDAAQLRQLLDALPKATPADPTDKSAI